MRKVGRPKLGEEFRRYKGYTLRLTKDEYGELKAKAAGANLSVAQYIRVHILNKKEEVND